MLLLTIDLKRKCKITEKDSLVLLQSGKLFASFHNCVRKKDYLRHSRDQAVVNTVCFPESIGATVRKGAFVTQRNQGDSFLVSTLHNLHRSLSNGKNLQRWILSQPVQQLFSKKKLTKVFLHRDNVLVAIAKFNDLR